MVLSISVTQAVLLFGDLGLARICIDVARPAGQQAHLRAQGQALYLLSTVVLLAVLAGLTLTLASARELLTVLMLGGLTAAAVSTEVYRAAAREVAGDEVGAAGHNFLWSNAPKIGLLVGVILLREPIPIVFASAVIAAGLCRPAWSTLRHAWEAFREYRLWLVTFSSIVASFILGWSDTYFLSAHLGVAKAGAYEALYRVLGACSYVFLPWSSVVVSRLSRREQRPLVRPVLLALTTTALTLGIAVLLVYTLAPSLFPQLELPVAAIPGLVVLYLLWPVANCLGTALYTLSRGKAVMVANTASAGACLIGHTVFTLRGGPTQAAWVSALAMALAVALLAVSYSKLRPREGAATGESLDALGHRSTGRGQAGHE